MRGKTRLGRTGRAGPLSPGAGLAWAGALLGLRLPGHICSCRLCGPTPRGPVAAAAPPTTAQQTVMSRAVLISNGSLKFWSRPSAHTAMSAEGGISRSQVRAGAPCRGAVLRAGFSRGAWTPVPCPPIPGPASLHLGSDTYRPRTYYMPWAGTKNMHTPVFVLRNWSQGRACRNTAVRSTDRPAHRTLPSIATARGAGSSSRPWA